VAQFRFDPDRSTLSVVGRSSVHPIRATAGGVVGWIDLDDDGRPVAGHLTVEVGELKTGNPLYDREIRNRLEARTFPTFEAHLGSVAEGGAAGSWTVGGSVSAHGVQADLDGTVTVAVEDDVVRVGGAEPVDFREFGLKAPRILTLRVEPIVTVELDAVARVSDQTG
jgi:hypothetical protein